MQEILISFKSGHYKSFKGTWKGDSVWGHFEKEDGTQIHVNKDEVEYIQSKSLKKPDLYMTEDGPRMAGPGDYIMPMLK